MKIIDMKGVVGSDTLCEYGLTKNGYCTINEGCLFTPTRIIRCRVAENIWQSTANNLVIPEGLVCDVQRININGGIDVYKGFLSSNINLRHDQYTSIKVTGTQEGWCYEWEKGE